MVTGTRNKTSILFLLIFAFYLLLRIPVIICNYFGMEPAYVLELSRRSWSDIVQNSMTNTFSPSYFIVLKYWGMISQQDWWITTYSVLVGAMTLIIVWVAGRRLFNDRIALAAAFFFTISAYGFRMSTEIRYHRMYALFTLWSMYEFAMLAREGDSFKRIARYTISTLLLVYTFHYALYIWAFQHLFLLFKRKYTARWIAGNAVVAVLYLPWFFVLRSQMDFLIRPSESVNPAYSFFVQHSFMNMLDVISALTGGKMILVHAHDPLSRFVYLGTLLVLASALWGLAISARKNSGPARASAWLLALCIGVSILFSYLGYLFLGVPFFTRYSVGYLPVLALFLAAGISYLKSRGVRVAVYALFVAVSFFSVRETWRQLSAPDTIVDAVRYLENHETGGAPVLVAPKYITPVLWHYYRGKSPIFGVPDDFNIASDDFKYKIENENSLAVIKGRTAAAPVFWVFMEREGIRYIDESGVFKKWLDGVCLIEDQYTFKSGPFGEPGSRLLKCVNRLYRRP